MPQSTNLNRSPYYDDFSDDKNFYKVLFKPGVSVQTRELTTLQSILQNQIEKFGSRFFSSGGVVIPGGFAYDNTFSAVEIDSELRGIDVEVYFQSLVGKVLTGIRTGITAKVEKVLSKFDSERGSTTLYVKYISSSSEDFNSEIFENGEELTVNSDISLGAGFILAGETIAQVSNPVGRSALSVGSAAKIEEGVYFVRGYFVNVESESIILEQYNNTPNARVGLTINEVIIDANDDSSLNDNAQGFSNFAAPGADRLTITLNLSSKSLDDFNDDNFIELFRVENGVIRKIKSDTASSFINDVLARRTFEESGNYYINQFAVDAVESLNDRIGNNGIYFQGQKTTQGSIPSEDLGLIKVNPGKAYVKGYEVPTVQTVLDFPKPRTTKKVESSSSNFYAGNIIRVNNVKNSPKIGLTTTGTISLYATRLQSGVAAGTTIGFARVYDYESHNTSYESPASQFNLSLFDIQTYTNIVTTAGVSSSVIVGSYIQGQSSGASGYLKSLSGGTNLSLYQVSGTFIKNETLTINGVGSTSSIGTVTDYSINDVRSISSPEGFVADTLLYNKGTVNGPFDVAIKPFTVGVGTLSGDFSTGNDDTIGVSTTGLQLGDLVQSTSIAYGTTIVAFPGSGIIQISPAATNVGVATEVLTINRPVADAGIVTITKNDGSAFAAGYKTGDIISYQTPGITSSIFTKIISISNTKNSIGVSSVSTVQNVCSSSVGVGTFQIQNISLLRPELLLQDDTSLYSKLSNNNISNVDLLNSNIYIKQQYSALTKSGTTLTLPDLSGTDYVYSSFDEERYLVVNANGSIENLTNATFTTSSGGKNASFTNLSAAAGPCSIITTQIKSNVTAKQKRYARGQSITINKTKYSTPKNAGLGYTSLYGTRVEDNQISLNAPDLVEVHAVYESSGTGEATVPWIALTGLNSPTSDTNDLIIGEYLVGETSGAVAAYVERRTGAQVYLAYKTTQTFRVSERVTFKETGYSAVVASVEVGDKNILNEFTVDNGQRKHFYDYGRLVRKNSSKEPSGRLRIYFDCFQFDNSDSGDLITRNSYPNSLYGKKIPSFDNVRNTDVIDVRPRVGSYSASTKLSPFDFSSRSFETQGANSSQIVASNENVVFDYDFYLPRSDKLTLSKEGVFEIVFGEPSETPIVPSVSVEVLDVATIISSPYVYDITDRSEVIIILTDNRRFTMSDLRDIEDRVTNLEYYTSLSLLETSTQNLLIEDADGFNRFKSGFFVDNFNNYNTSEIENPLYSADILESSLRATINQERIDLSLYSSDVELTPSEINLADTNCNNLKLTGTTLSLNYTNTVYFSQPFASRIVNVNPFNIVTWTGFLQLNPAVDTWEVQVNAGAKFIPNWNLAGAFNPRTGTRDARLDHFEVTRTDIPYIRSRNIQFIGSRLKPNTRFNVIFDSKNLSDSSSGTTFAFPKLLEITDVLGSFKVGETVVGSDSNGNKIIKFRVCTPNHKDGPHNSPTVTYTINPYTPTVGISTLYGPQSTVLNIDTESLQVSNISNYFGNAIRGISLYGLESRASAKIADNRLISDSNGTLIGSIFIPDPNTNSVKYRTGSTEVKLVTSQPALGVPGEFTSSAETTFTSRGTEVRSTSVFYYDPLAQTFIVNEETGVFPTSVDIFFASKDDTIPVTLQIREAVNGYPGGPDKVVGKLEKVLRPDQVTTSTNATAKTSFTFDSLTRLEGGREYSIVLLSDSNNYNVWHSRIGEVEITTANSNEVGKVIINKQPSMGTMFKSQNGTTWVASPEDDLKFTINKANFVSSGTARFYNSKVATESSENLLLENSLFAISTSAVSENSGRHILVFHPNHGMHSPNNKVQIKGVQSDILPVKLSVAYGATETGAISVASTTIFANYDGSQVGPGNPGYIQISDEIIKYEKVLSGQLSDITRASLDTVSLPHSVDSLVYKYEFNNIPLTKINTTHTILNSPKPTLDNYYVQVSAGSTFNIDKFAGGSGVYASKNKQFNQAYLNPYFINTFNRTSVSGSVRTISARSVDGTETAFVDQGFESFDTSSTNNFITPRTIASKVNETEYLNSTEFAGSKSLTLELGLDTSDPNVSPVINIDQSYLTAENYRINQPVGLSSYASDSRVNSNLSDPHSFLHVSKRINLQESANSLKVLFSAFRSAESDIRVLYKIYRNDVPDEDQTWELFPGYENLDVNGLVIDSDDNDGRSDSNVPSNVNGEYRDYSYTIDNLPSFTGFQVKIVGTSSNQAYSPIIKELRALALK
jgi:hypothetical protein